MPDLDDIRKSLAVREIIRKVLLDSNLISDPKIGAVGYETYTITTAEIISALNKADLKIT